MKTRILTAALVLSGLAAIQPAASQHGHDAHHGHTSSASEPASTADFKAAAQRMHSDMAIDYTGDADVDFVKGMIPHHQGAIDMARIELKHGKDPELRKLAQKVVDAQTLEIEAMKEWLAERGH